MALSLIPPPPFKKERSGSLWATPSRQAREGRETRRQTMILLVSSRSAIAIAVPRAILRQWGRWAAITFARPFPDVYV